jgi:hypothetical protein
MDDISSYLAQSTGSQKSINKNTVFGQLMTVVSGIAHNIMLYIEDSLVEQNKYTAQRKKSVLGLAAQSGYQPSYGKAAGVWVRIAHKVNNRVPLDVIVAEHQKILCSQNGLYYNLVLNKAATTIKCDTNLVSEYIYAVQGQFDTQRFTATGGSLYVQNMKFTGYIDTDYITVKVNDEEWEQVASLYDMAPDQKAYAIRYNPVSGIDIIFGNDINGRIIGQGDVIEVSYLLHDGESGNIDVKESGYFLFADKLKDVAGEEVDGNTCFDISFASEDAVAAGANPESITKIRQMIGFNTRSLVLSDSNAYKAFLNKFSFVGYNRTWSEPGSLVVNSLVMRNYQLDMQSGEDYFDLRPNQFSLSDIQKASIQNAILASGAQLAGTTYNIIDIELCKYACYLYIKLKDSSTDKSLITTQIRTLVGEFFGDIQSDSYIPKSDIINLIKDNIDEVDGVNCYFLSERNETALQTRMYQDTQYIFDPVTGTYRTKTSTVRLVSGENPMLGLDAHGNIVVDADNQFPVLMGGWDFLNSAGQEVDVTDPLIIVYE